MAGENRDRTVRHMATTTSLTPLSRLPDQRAAADPEAPCLADKTGTLTNAEVLDRVIGAARLFAGLGVGPGDVVAVMLPNQIELLVTLFAAWRLGAAVTPINPALTADEAGHQLIDSQARLIVNSNGSALAGGVVSVAATTLSNPGPGPDGAPLPTPVVDPADLALLIYTSGTTGRPKGVMLDHANVAAMCAMTLDALHLNDTDHSLLILPLFHVNGIVVGSLTPLLAGGRVTIAERFDPSTFFDVVARVRPTYFSAVPTIYAMLCALPDDVSADMSSLRVVLCGAAPMPAELIVRFESRFGVPIVEGYGLSECSCVATVNPIDGLRKPGTVGLPLPGVEIRIDAPDGEAGEVLIKGANVMQGYLGRPDETTSTIVDGWLRTGDVGRFDADGYLVLVDRVKDMIIRGGENI